MVPSNSKEFDEARRVAGLATRAACMKARLLRAASAKTGGVYAARVAVLAKRRSQSHATLPTVGAGRGAHGRFGATAPQPTPGPATAQQQRLLWQSQPLHYVRGGPSAAPTYTKGGAWSWAD